jgi:hypothetical protein
MHQPLGTVRNEFNKYTFSKSWTVAKLNSVIQLTIGIPGVGDIWHLWTMDQEHDILWSVNFLQINWKQGEQQPSLKYI